MGYGPRRRKPRCADAEEEDSTRALHVLEPHLGSPDERPADRSLQPPSVPTNASRHLPPRKAIQGERLGKWGLQASPRCALLADIKPLSMFILQVEGPGRARERPSEPTQHLLQETVQRWQGARERAAGH
ncbi:hypothetical protein AX14_002018 [Amanita brunnescens Koide BX004]|nr:hypothetical protein AX14_002018 [Amanita brunnescens Koide BX004]